MGLILNYAYPAVNTPIYDLACKDVCNSSCANKTSFEVGEDIQLRSGGDENVVVAEVLSKVFRNNEGNYIEQTVSASSCGKLDSYVMSHSKNTVVSAMLSRNFIGPIKCVEYMYVYVYVCTCTISMCILWQTKCVLYIAPISEAQNFRGLAFFEVS